MRTFSSLFIAGVTLLVGGLFFVEVWAVTAQQSVSVVGKIALMLARTPPRHVAVIIENHTGARPYQEGLETSPLIMEMIVEGGISRFVVLFDADDLPERAGPVRSLRPYLFTMALPYVTDIIHAGGSPEAFDIASRHPDTPAVNLLRFAGKGMRDHAIPAPHNLFIEKDDIGSVIGEQGENGRTMKAWPPFPARFRIPQDSPSATDITVNFGSRAHNVSYAYDAKSGTYARVNGDEISEAHPAAILMLETPITAIGELGRLTLDLRGGEGFLFRKGVMIPVRWQKESDTSPIALHNERNEEIGTGGGPLWIMGLPNLQRVTWK